MGAVVRSAVVLLGLLVGCGPRAIPLTVDATACNLDECPTIRVETGGAEQRVDTFPSRPEVWPITKVGYYPSTQDEGIEISFKIICLEDDGCPSCFGEGSTFTFDPLTINMSPEGN